MNTKSSNEKMSWEEAIKKVLKEEKTALHYKDIAIQIAEKNYRTNLGATPENSVNAALQKLKGNVRPIPLQRGMYIWESYYNDYMNKIPIETKSEFLIGAFGRYWRRDLVQWNNIPDIQIFGIQSLKADKLDFGKQIGIYLLHLGHEIIYVGRTTDQSLATRLYQHTQMKDPLNNRWDRFSWFGIYPVDGEKGVLKTSQQTVQLNNNELIATLEAFLIEVTEPGLNKKNGDKIKDNEYYQFEK